MAPARTRPPHKPFTIVPEVVIRATADKTGITSGQTVTLKAYVKYLGFLDATNVVAMVTVPSNLTIASGTNGVATNGTATKAGNTYTWTIGTMRNGDEYVLTITATGNPYTRRSAAPDLTPVDGTGYTAGETVGNTYILYTGTATSVTDLLVTHSEDYYYSVYAYNGSGTAINYLLASPLTGIIDTRNTNTHSVSASSSLVSVGVPGFGVSISFRTSVAAGGTNITVSQFPTRPANYTNGLPAGIRSVGYLHYTVTSSNPSPGEYNIVLDFSTLNLTDAEWAAATLLKRSNSSSSWEDVTNKVSSTKVDGVTGKVLLSGLTSFSDFAVGSASATLPVIWGPITAKEQKKKGVLKWSTLQEIQSDKFSSQHSLDERSWMILGSMPASGNSTSEKQYSFVHYAPSPGKNYYRVMQFDRDGSVTFSPIVKFHLTGIVEELHILGNPVTNGELLIQLAQGREVTILQISGGFSISKELPPGYHSIDVSTLPKGIYIVKAGNSSKRIAIQ